MDCSRLLAHHKPLPKPTFSPCKSKFLDSTNFTNSYMHLGSLHFKVIWLGKFPAYLMPPPTCCHRLWHTYSTVKQTLYFLRLLRKQQLCEKMPVSFTYCREHPNILGLHLVYQLHSHRQKSNILRDSFQPPFICAHQAEDTGL